MAKKKQPTVLKLAEGKKVDPDDIKNEPMPDGDLFHAPEHFNERQLAIWQAAIESAPNGLLRDLDQAVLSVWVIAKDTHTEATKELAEDGLTILTPSGYPVQNPCLQIINKQAEIMIKSGSEMGFSPSSRTKVKVSKALDKGNRFSSNGRKRSS